jgi:membrane fusion protein, multidrug efflux system
VAAMKRRILIIASLLVVAVGVLALVRGDRPDDATHAAVPRAETVVPVRVTPVRELTLTQTIVYSGTLEAWERAYVGGQSGQRIERIHVREGDAVRRGQLLAEMDGTNLRQAEVELRVAHNDLERIERLVEIGALARQQFEQAEAHYEVARANVELLRANTRLLAPIDGIVTGKHFVEGEQLVAGAETPAVVTVQTVDPLKVVVNVSERYFPVIRRNGHASVRLDTYPGETFDGYVTQINPVVNPDSRTFRVELRLDNGDRRLSPGMFARVALELGDIVGLFVPRSAVQMPRGGGTPFVYVVEENQALRMALELGERVDGLQQVVSGLARDARVVIDGAGRLHDGAPVRIVD